MTDIAIYTDWYTPAAIANAARSVMGSIDLDPASCPAANDVVRATHYFAAEDDGLAQDWFGNVWLNPPTDQIDAFAKKLLREYTLCNIYEAVMFVHNDTQSDWYQNLSQYARAIAMPAGHIEHWRPGGETFTPTWGNNIFYFGGKADEFYMNFQQFGTVWTI